MGPFVMKWWARACAPTHRDSGTPTLSQLTTPISRSRLATAPGPSEDQYRSVGAQRRYTGQRGHRAEPHTPSPVAASAAATVAALLGMRLRLRNYGATYVLTGMPVRPHVHPPAARTHAHTQRRLQLKCSQPCPPLNFITHAAALPSTEDTQPAPT